MLDRAFWTTNSKKDWNDFWYNSEDIYPKQTKHNYNELVDYQVQTMKNPPFNSEAYRNYKEQTNNKRSPSAYNIRPPFIPKTVSSTERQSFDELYEQFHAMSIPEQIENLKGLGRELVERIDRIVDRLDVILEEDKKD